MNSLKEVIITHSGHKNYSSLQRAVRNKISYRKTHPKERISVGVYRHINLPFKFYSNFSRLKCSVKKRRRAEHLSALCLCRLAAIIENKKRPVDTVNTDI